MRIEFANGNRLKVPQTLPHFNAAITLLTLGPMSIVLYYFAHTHTPLLRLFVFMRFRKSFQLVLLFLNLCNKCILLITNEHGQNWAIVFHLAYNVVYIWVEKTLCKLLQFFLFKLICPKQVQTCAYNFSYIHLTDQREQDIRKANKKIST